MATTASYSIFGETWALSMTYNFIVLLKLQCNAKLNGVKVIYWCQHNLLNVPFRNWSYKMVCCLFKTKLCFSNFRSFSELSVRYQLLTIVLLS